jgi:hypothetical protein
MFRCAIAILLLAGTVPAQRQSREELIAALVKRGDDLSVESKAGARCAYLFALFFATPDSSIAAQARSKIDSLGIRPAEVFSLGKSDDSSPLLLPLDFHGFPKRTRESDLVNLRMLLDDRLVGDVYYTGVKPGVKGFVFASKPRLRMDEIRRTYGAPAIEQSTVNGREVLTYGMFRIFGDASGRVALVAFGQ